MRLFASIVFSAAILFCPVAVKAQGYLHASSRQIVDGTGQPFRIRGIGLGGWMVQEGYELQVGDIPQHLIRQKIEALVGPKKTEQFYTAWLDNYVTKADIDALAGWGFNAVRLPMHYHLLTDSIDEEPVPGKNTWKEDGFRRIDELLKWCEDNKIYLILDLHAAPGGQGNKDFTISDRDPSKPSLWESPANQEKLVALWSELATRYRGKSFIGGYDLLNEPNVGFQNPNDKAGCDETSNAPLQDLLKRTIAAIRKEDLDHMIFVEGNCFSNNYKGMSLDYDSNMVFTFHKYWTNTNRDSIVRFLDLSQTVNKPVWMGEAGENSNEWYSAAIRTADDNEIGWSWWPLKKSSVNNPLQIEPNKGFKAIMKYWDGKGPKPTERAAFASLMALATQDIKFGHNIFHKDVIDAMFRGANSDSTLPFKLNTVGRRTVIKAVDYDMGRDGKAFYNRISANYYVDRGGSPKWKDVEAYRNDGFDIFFTNTGEPYVGKMKSGEWLRYTLTVKEPGAYVLSLGANANSPVRMSVRLNGVAVPSTAPTSFALALDQGNNDLVVQAESDDIDLKTLTFRRSMH